MVDRVYIGINGNVICLDRSTGEGLWLAELDGSGFVNVLVDGNRVIATTMGEAFCIDAATGKRLWHNQLSGQGRGLATIATANNAAGSVLMAEKLREDEAAAAGAGTVAGSLIR